MGLSNLSRTSIFSRRLLWQTAAVYGRGANWVALESAWCAEPCRLRKIKKTSEMALVPDIAQLPVKQGEEVHMPQGSQFRRSSTMPT